MLSYWFGSYETPIYDQDISKERIFPPPILPDEEEAINELRSLVEDEELYQENQERLSFFVSQDYLHRYLRSRSWDIEAARAMIVGSLEWFLVNNPDSITPDEIEEEAFTGKIRCPSKDRHGRPIIIFDNTKENTTEVEGQMRFFLFNLWRATRLLEPPVEKFCCFIHLEHFSPYNTPSIQLTTDTILTVLNHFPERLGHCVMFQSPWLFSTLWSAVSTLLDPVTRAKVVFIDGDYSVGSQNDLLLKKLICDDWKEITGVDAPSALGVSPGYDHDVYWPQVVEDFNSWQEETNKEEPEP